MTNLEQGQSYSSALGPGEIKFSGVWINAKFDSSILSGVSFYFDPIFSRLLGDKKSWQKLESGIHSKIPKWKDSKKIFQATLVTFFACLLLILLINGAEAHGVDSPSNPAHPHSAPSENNMQSNVELHIKVTEGQYTDTLGMNEPKSEEKRYIATLSAKKKNTAQKVNVCFSGSAEHVSDYKLFEDLTSTSELSLPNKCLLRVIPANGFKKDFVIEIQYDNVKEEDGEFIYMNLAHVEDTSLSLSTVVNHIRIDDRITPPPVTPVVSITGGNTITEGGTATYTLTATPAPASPLKVNVTVVDSGDFASSGQAGTRAVTIGTSGTGTLKVTTDDDSTEESNGTLTATVDSGESYTPSGSQGSASITVNDDDGINPPPPPPVTPVVSITGGNTITEGGTATYTLTATPAPASPLKVNVTVVDSGDFASSGQAGTRAVTIGTSGTGTLKVTTDDDSTEESNGTLTATVDSGESYTPSGSQGSASITVNDDDGINPPPPPPVTPVVSITGGNTITESGTAEFTLTADPAPTASIAVIINVSGGTNFGVTNGTQTVTINTSGIGLLTVPTKENDTYENDGTITATVNPDTGTEPTYRIGRPSTASVNVKDNEPRLEINPKNVVVKEGDDKGVTYTVKLSKAPSSPVSVEITGNLDPNVIVTPTTPLTFTDNQPQTVTIKAVEDDDKVSESIQLRHKIGSYDSNENIVQVTVRDNDIPPSETVGAGLVRFGRTVGEQSVSAIGDRISAARYPSFKGVLAGYQLPGGRCDETTVKTPGNLDLIKQQRSCVENQRQVEDTIEFSPSSQTLDLTEEDILTGTSFALTQEINSGDMVTMWGQGTRSGFSGKTENHSVKGYVTGFQMGVDWSHYNKLYGVMLSRNTGDVKYSSDDETRGDIDFGLTALVPYMGWNLDDNFMVWGGLGFGSGSLTRKEEDADDIKTDISWRMVALGTEGALPEIEALAGAELSWSTDILWTQTSADGVEDYLEPLSGKTLRRRMGFKSTWERTLASGSTLRPSLEVAIRNDGGDAETGLGLQAGGGLEWIDTQRGLSFSLSGQKLIVHEKDEFKNWSMSISLLYDPSPKTKQGFAASLSHNVGDIPPSGNLLQAETLPGTEDFNEGESWNAEMAYGVSQGNGKVGSSYMAVKGQSEDETARLGYRLEPDFEYAQNMMIDVWTEPEVGNSQKSKETGNSVGVNLISRW